MMTEIAKVITPVNEKKSEDFLLDKDTVITNGSAITVRSQSSSSLADKSGYNTEDDAESSHDSFDTIATTNENEKEVESTTVGRRRRALTVTQNPRVVEMNSNNYHHDDDHIQELQQSTSLIVGNQDYSDSDSLLEDEIRTHKRNESHRSTMSSIHSFVSSASNYDLLLARLGSKDASTTSLTTIPKQSNEELDYDQEVIVAPAVVMDENEQEDDEKEEEIDWGKL
ncbi:hypothetical protein BD770DRAFT_81671 [Pilaira anomala]|nr:hypothetical protein BD770DRAFT_81671 [Pilaira anomala]